MEKKKRTGFRSARMLLGGLAVLTAFTLTACSSSGGGAGKSKSRGKKIYVIGQSQGIQFWDDVEVGVRDAAEEFDHDIHYSCSKSMSDIQGQITLINEAIAQKADAIVIAPNSDTELDESIQKAKAAGIAVVAMNADFSDSSLRSSYVGTNNLTSGKIAGRHAAEVIKDPLNDKILIMSHSEEANSSTQRVGGFMSITGPYIGQAAQKAAMEARAAAQAAAQARQAAEDEEGAGGPPEGAGGPPAGAQQGEAGGPPEGAGQDSSSTFIQECCQGDANIAKTKTMDALKKNPDIKLIYTTNESSTLGVCQAIQEMNYQPGEITVIGFNSSDTELQYLRSGVLDALVVQNPYNIGYLSVYYAGQVAGGSSVAGMDRCCICHG
jgi:ribose transport system substrate-binding protein